MGEGEQRLPWERESSGYHGRGGAAATMGEGEQRLPRRHI